MNKMLAWVLSLTKLNKVVTPVQSFLSGKKAYIAGAALIVPALATMIQNFSDGGVSYLLAVTHTPEFDAFMQGVGIMGLRAAISKAADPSKDPNASAKVG
jgi:hypothetical protein